MREDLYTPAPQLETGRLVRGAHDFAEVLARGVRDLFRAAPVLVCMAALVLGMSASAIAWHQRTGLARLLAVTCATTPRLAVWAACAAVAIATLIDLPLGVFDYDLVRATEELLELSAGGLLFTAALLAGRSPGGRVIEPPSRRA